MIVADMIFPRIGTMFGAHIVKNRDIQKKCAGNFMVKHMVSIVLMVLKGDNNEAKVYVANVDNS